MASSISRKRQAVEAASPEPKESDYAAIIARRICGGSEEDIERQAIVALQSALENDSINLTYLDNMAVVANPTGLGFARFAAKKIQATLDEHTKELTRLNEKSKLDDEKLEAMRRDIEQLSATSLDDPNLRQRFIVNFKKKMPELGPVNREDQERADRVNKRAHEGDCICDASLYSPGGRTDVGVFEALYGLRVHEVKKIRIGDRSTIKALNRYATDVAKPKHRITDEYTQAFRKFIEAFRNSNYEEGWDLHPDSLVFMTHGKLLEASRVGLLKDN